jgi:hypothetical protein
MAHLPQPVNRSSDDAISGRGLALQGTIQVIVTAEVRPAATVADWDGEHGSFPPDPLLVPMAGDRPATWYLPGGSRTENLPDEVTWTVTGRCLASVKVTVPERSLGCAPSGPSGPPSLSSLPAR